MVKVSLALDSETVDVHAQGCSILAHPGYVTADERMPQHFPPLILMNYYSRYQISLLLIFVCLAIKIFEAKAVETDPPSVDLLGVVRLDGHVKDLSKLSGKLENGSYSDQFGGLSAIDYTGHDNRFLLLSDRGAGDGAVTYPCRFHEARLTVDPQTKQIHVELLSTTMLTSSTGKPLVGSLIAHDADLRASDSKHWTAFDPEGMRWLDNGLLMFSDEYGPRVVIADESGHIRSEFNIPEPFRLRLPVSGIWERGVYPNRGLEGIAITPSGNRIVASLQSPLVQDGRLEASKCLGLNCRWLFFGTDHSVIRQVDYRVDDLTSGVSEILAVDEDRFLVLERDGLGGELAKIKKIYLANTISATDVSGIPTLPPTEIPDQVQSVSKQLFLDLQDARFGLGGSFTPEKPEGLCWGQPLPDGRRTLWVCCDNDFDVMRTSDIYCFAVAGSFNDKPKATFSGNSPTPAARR